VTFTAGCEEELDEIEEGKLPWRDGGAGVLGKICRRSSQGRR